MAIINNEILGENSIKGGVFFDSSLLPSGTFKNVPSFYDLQIKAKKEEAVLTSTLEKIKESIKLEINKTENADVSDDFIERYLYQFINLLVDYKDMRNFVFYGSANTEIAYNIKYLLQNYPYKFLISTLENTVGLSSSLIILKPTDYFNKETTLIIKQDAIKDGIEFFNFYDNAINFNWKNYDIVDKDNRVYPIKNIITPYTSSTIFNIAGISLADYNGYFYTAKISTNGNHNYTQNDRGKLISLVDTVYIDGNTNLTVNLNGEYCILDVPNSSNILIVNKYSQNDILTGNYNVAGNEIYLPNDPQKINYINSSGRIRKFPLNQNEMPFTMKIVVDGNITEANMFSYEKSLNTYKGFIISPKKSILINFEQGLTPIQNMLLSPQQINPYPWPRRSVTNNIQNLLDDSEFNIKEQEFIDWLKDPNFLFLKDNIQDDDISFSDVYTEYRLIRALGLDETQTNQLIRRCIPEGLINELNDTENANFQRFLLIAGWFFDQVRLYIKFLNYVHHINVSDFNQLSPEYYKYYASHYGFELFSDDGIDFSKLVINTEPGLYYQTLEAKDNKYYKYTLQKLQYERQKRLLVSLFHLYKSKGTIETINKMVSLLGAPEGFFIFNEFVYNINSNDSFGYFDTTNTVGYQVVDNNKIYTPEIFFEEDVNHLKDIVPYYKMRLKNENQYNLRSAEVLTNPNGAIDFQVKNIFGEQKYYYGKLNAGEFFSLQAKTGNFSLLPLSIPDKFSGILLEYMIPKGGYVKGIANDLEEANINLCYLYKIGNDFTNNFYNGKYPYYLPIQYSNYNFTTIGNVTTPTSDFSILNRYMNNNISTNLNIGEYISVRLEGKDLVIRLRLLDEPTNNTYVERVAIATNIFSADGLNHSLKLLFRPEGVEIYKDYKFKNEFISGKTTIALWRDATTSTDLVPYYAISIPKIKILTCSTLPIDSKSFLIGTSSNTGLDGVANWDLFAGLPVNIDMYFKKIAVFENYSIDSYDIAESNKNNSNFTSEYFSFLFSNNKGDISDLKISCINEKMKPNISNSDYSYYPSDFNEINLYSHNLNEYFNTVAPNTKYFYIKQDFFNVDNIFSKNAYQDNIHKSYEYDNFNDSVLNLYSLYSPQVLTYQSLEGFLNLIENNFQNIIRSFIPIVINLSEFGRLITNSLYNQKKMRYTNVHKLCTGEYYGNGLKQLRVFNYVPFGQNFTIEFNNVDSSNTITQILPPILVTWNGNIPLTNYKLLSLLRDPAVNIYKDNLTVMMNDNLLSLKINSLWYNNTFGFMPNDLQISIKNDLGTVIYFEGKFEHGSIIPPTTNDCISIEYVFPPSKDKKDWIYYASENQPEMFINNASEIDSTPRFIEYSA